MKESLQQNQRPAPCGIVCETCVHLIKGCAGCAQGGGETNCFIRDCTKRKTIQGCWQCDTFPCEHFQKIDPAWRGLTVGQIELIKEMGENAFTKLALKNIGLHIDYGTLRFKTSEEIKDHIRKGTQPAA